MKIFRPVALALTLITCAGGLSAQESTRIETGSQVTFTYALSLADGTFLESNRDADPMAYVQGSGQIIPGLDAAMLGRSAGDTFKVTIQPDDAYGQIDPMRIQEVPIENIPAAARVEGATLAAQGFPGPITVREVREDVVVLDFNHPLAGEALEFDVEVNTVTAPAEPATEESEAATAD